MFHFFLSLLIHNQIRALVGIVVALGLYTLFAVTAITGSGPYQRGCYTRQTEFYDRRILEKR